MSGTITDTQGGSKIESSEFALNPSYTWHAMRNVFSNWGAPEAQTIFDASLSCVIPL